MKQSTLKIIAMITGLIVLIAGLIQAQTSQSAAEPRQMESLKRGVIAIHQGDGKVYIGWRLLGTDPDNIAFNVYS